MRLLQVEHYTLILLGFLFGTLGCGKKDSKSPLLPPGPKLLRELDLDAQVETILLHDDVSIVRTLDSQKILRDSGDLNLQEIASESGLSRSLFISTGNQLLGIRSEPASEETKGFDNEGLQAYALNALPSDGFVLSAAASSDRLWTNNRLVYLFIRGEGLRVAQLNSAGQLDLLPTPRQDQNLTPLRLFIKGDEMVALDFTKGVVIYSLADPLNPTKIAELGLSLYHKDIIPLAEDRLLASTVDGGLFILVRNAGTYRIERQLPFRGSTHELAISGKQIFVVEKIFGQPDAIVVGRLTDTAWLTERTFPLNQSIQTFAIDVRRELLVIGTGVRTIQHYSLKNILAAQEDLP